LDSFVKWENITGDEEIEITGRLIGGCLDVLLNLVGTKYDNTVNFIEKYKEDGIIWYFDNCDLSSEEIIRAFWQLKESGWLKYVNGIVFGRSATEDGYYMSFKEAVYESLNYLNVPIIVNADLGHKAPRMTLINGSIATFKSKDGKGSLTQKII
jgi:muramoyltetrapeptide carboxypeptidase LdcA involved in peptidoglycan recycling